MAKQILTVDELAAMPDFQSIPLAALEKVADLANGRASFSFNVYRECMAETVATAMQQRTDLPPTTFFQLADFRAQGLADKYQAETDNGKTFWRDGSGRKMLDTNYEPMTAGQIFANEFRDVQGQGSTPAQAMPASTTTKSGHPAKIDLSGATTQVQADDKIREYLRSEGENPTTVNWLPMFNELRTAANVEKLPIC